MHNIMDLNNDGHVTTEEEFLSFMIFNEITKSVKQEESEDDRDED